MKDRYITEGEEILTRVTLKIGGRDYVIESIYSDESLLELGMLCIEGYMADINKPREYIKKAINKVLNNEVFGYDAEYSMRGSFEFIFEQYEKKEIVKGECGFNVVGSLISALKSCAVLATWLPVTVDDFLREYADCFDDEEESEDETDVVLAPWLPVTVDDSLREYANYFDDKEESEDKTENDNDDILP